MSKIKLASWNVNGIRAAVRNGFVDYLKQEKPDILCLQEIKIDNEARAKEQFDFPKYEEYWNPADKKGYSGTAILVKPKLVKEIQSYTEGIGVKKFDTEGRVQTLEFTDFYLINAYFPNTRPDLSRLKFKVEFNNKMWAYLNELQQKKPIIITGDFNVAHTEIDLKNAKPNEKNAGYTIQERNSFSKLMSYDYIDTFRYLHPEKIQYSWWTYRFGARKRNVGWRIDYFCTSNALKDNIKKAYIQDDIMGSDHCPIGLEIDI